MADLIAIGYPDETTAIAAQQEAERLSHELSIQPDAIAAIVRHRDGKFKVHTSAQPVTGGTTYGMFWGLLFGLLFFVPLFGSPSARASARCWRRSSSPGWTRSSSGRCRTSSGPGPLRSSSWSRT